MPSLLAFNGDATAGNTPFLFFLELQLYVTVSFFKNVSNILFGYIY